jgi:hypothetical protein
MNIWTKWKLGALAMDAMRWARDLIGTLDATAAIEIVMKIVELERDWRGKPGQAKLAELLQWITGKYPGGDAAVITGYVSALVSLLNALGVFRK